MDLIFDVEADELSVRDDSDDVDGDSQSCLGVATSKSFLKRLMSERLRLDIDVFGVDAPRLRS